MRRARMKDGLSPTGEAAESRGGRTREGRGGRLDVGGAPPAAPGSLARARPAPQRSRCPRRQPAARARAGAARPRLVLFRHAAQSFADASGARPTALVRSWPSIRSDEFFFTTSSLFLTPQNLPSSAASQAERSCAAAPPCSAMTSEYLEKARRFSRLEERRGSHTPSCAGRDGYHHARRLQRKQSPGDPEVLQARLRA